MTERARASHEALRMTVFAVAMTCGMLLGLAVHIVSARFGIGLTSVWHDLFATNANALRGAFGWWAIAGAGLFGSFLAGLLAEATVQSQTRHRMRRSIIALVFFAILAAVPYFAVAAPAPSLPVAFATNALAFGLATVTAFCGSWFVMPK